MRKILIAACLMAVLVLTGCISVATGKCQTWDHEDYTFKVEERISVGLFPTVRAYLDTPNAFFVEEVYKDSGVKKLPSRKAMTLAEATVLPPLSVFYNVAFLGAPTIFPWVTEAKQPYYWSLPRPKEVATRPTYSIFGYTKYAKVTAIPKKE